MDPEGDTERTTWVAQGPNLSERHGKGTCRLPWDTLPPLKTAVSPTVHSLGSDTRIETVCTYWSPRGRSLSEARKLTGAQL